MKASPRMTVPEAARRLGIPGGDVYRLIFSGELAGGPDVDLARGPDRDFAVYVTVEEVERYAAAHPPKAAAPGGVSGASAG